VNGGRNYNGPKVRFASLSKIWLYAGSSEYPTLREMLWVGHGFSRAVNKALTSRALAPEVSPRDNVMGADNQQERSDDFG
jgi:hypothetical protein